MPESKGDTPLGPPFQRGSARSGHPKTVCWAVPGRDYLHLINEGDYQSDGLWIRHCEPTCRFYQQAEAKQSEVRERDCFVAVTPRSDIGGLSFRLELIRVKSLSGVFRS